jgi:hypothetical protein
MIDRQGTKGKRKAERGKVYTNGKKYDMIEASCKYWEPEEGVAEKTGVSNPKGLTRGLRSAAFKHLRVAITFSGPTPSCYTG